MAATPVDNVEAPVDEQHRNPQPHQEDLGVAGNLLAIVFLGSALSCCPALFGIQRYVINGTSMTGTIDYGSVVFDKVVPVSDLRVGDVITYQPPAGFGVDHMVTHRIVAIHGDVFRTQGDAVPQRDPWKFKLNHPTQARVVFAVPYAGYPFLWLADRDTRMLAIGLPAGVIALLSLGQIVTILRGKDEQAPDASGHPSVPVSG